MAKTIEQAIQDYINRGFGSMTKNDFEVWIFSQWIADPKNKEKSNYKISRELRIPESKVKRLRYEVDLNYQDTSDEEKNAQIIALLTKAQLKRNGAQIQFNVEDPVMRKYMDHLLKQAGYFADSSFNSEVVSLTIDDWGKLLEVTDSNSMAELLKKGKKKLNKSDLTARELLDIFLKNVAESSGKAVGGFTIAGIKSLLGLI